MAEDDLVAIRSELIRRIWGSFNFLHGISREWGFVLLHPDFDREPSLRNKVFAIWLCALAENAAESVNSLNGLRRQARRIDAKIAIYYLDLIAKIHEGVADALSPLSFQDMVAIHELRNRLVHGELYATKLAVRFSEGGLICTKRIQSDEARAIFTELWLQKGWDGHLLESRVKIMSKRSLFWILYALMMPDNIVERIMNDVRQWDNSISPGVFVQFVDDSYAATQTKVQEDLRTFWYNRAATASGPTQGIDPAISLIQSRTGSPDEP